MSYFLWSVMSTVCEDAESSPDSSPVVEQEVYSTDAAGTAIRTTMTELEGAVVFSSHGRQSSELRYEQHQDTPCLHLYFSLEGISSAHPRHSEDVYRLDDNQHVVSYSPGFEGYYATNGPVVRNFGVTLRESFFRRLIVAEPECLLRFRERVEAGKPSGISRYPMPVTARQKAVIDDLLHCMYTGRMKLLYYESKIIELFLLQAEQAANLAGYKPTPIKPADRDKLYAARHFVEQHMLDPLTLTQVARETGLNDFKLKKGFRELFGSTVFGYLNELRMNYARSLLLDTSCTVFEVAQTLGYSEPHNFTQAFKRYFGYLPGTIKKQRLM